LIVFHDPAFPGAVPLGSAPWGSAELADAEALAGRLDAAGAGACLLYLHAPYFPKDAWTAILGFLKRGGGLVSAGGAPFKHPVRREGAGWEVEAEQTAYHRQLHVHEALQVEGGREAAWEANEDIPLCAGQEPLWSGASTWNLVPHVTRQSDLPEQMGSAGPMDTAVYPLVRGLSKEGRPVSVPVVLWEHRSGPFRGGRWIWTGRPEEGAFARRDSKAALERLAAFAAEGVTELAIKPNFAAYEPGEQACLTLQAQHMSETGQPEAAEWIAELTVEPPGGPVPSFCRRLTMLVTQELSILRIRVPMLIEPGLYRVRCRLKSPGGEVRVLRQGFWGHDGKLLAEGEPISCGKDYFRRGDEPLPVIGTTYMASDVARKFLFLPNPDVWDRDMARMVESGINWIRTGIWTAYRHVMQVDGHIPDELLRAIDAFLLTAKRHGLQTTFTFFSFTPESWEGSNPYLDPRSLEAQKRFIRLIVSRHTRTTYVDWDLINEPSLFDPQRIFAHGPRSARDHCEREAFRSWLLTRHGSLSRLQAAWGMTPDELPSIHSVQPPEADEINFEIDEITESKHGCRWLDYCLFSMDMHNAWAKELAQTIKKLSARHLVTVGQDEALGAQRPSPFYYQESVDYTTIHPWWLNDALLWSGVFAKTPDKPNLAQEVGIMYAETPDGRAKRTEAELAAILERKLAYSFAAGGAGVIQWIWNSNYYMNNVNESHIGALRADGSEKPEASVLQNFGRFLQTIRPLFGDRKQESVAVVFPYSNDFSNRKFAFEATTRLSRVLGYQIRVPFRAVSEYHLETLEAQPAALIVLPSAHNVDNEAIKRLLAIAEKTGATLAVTGPLGLDAYWRPSDRLNDLLGRTEMSNVRREELLKVDGRSHPVSFGGTGIARYLKEAPKAQEDRQYDEPVLLALGKGRLLWCPLPLEVNDRDEPIAAFYRYSLRLSGVQPELEWIQGGENPGIYGRKLEFSEGALFVFVSEFSWDATVEIRNPANGMKYRFLLPAERSVLFATDRQGQLLSRYRPNKVTIECVET